MENNTQNNDIVNNVEEKKNLNNNLISIIIVFCILALGIFLLIKTEPKAKNIKSSDEASIEELNNAIILPNPNEHILGDLNTAKVVIVEYSDTECPFCKRFHGTMHQILKETNGQIAWVYRHFPIEQLHAKAFKESLATECATEQGGNEIFWKYIDEIYTQTNSNDSLPESALTGIALELGLDMVKFQDCLNTQKYKDLVDAQILSGQNLGVEGTPTSFVIVNGEVVDTIKGALPFANVMSEIKDYLE